MLRSLRRLRPRRGAGRPLGGHRGRPRFFRVTKRLHNRLHGARATRASRHGRTRDLRAPLRLNAEVLRRADAAGGRRPAARPADGRHDPAAAGAGVPVIWRAHVGLDLPNEAAREAWHFLRRTSCRATRTSSPGPRTPGRAWTRAKSRDRAVDRRLLAEEPGDVVHGRDGGAARGRPRRRPPSPARAAFERLDGTLGRGDAAGAT